jgi:hypothetical protein
VQLCREKLEADLFPPAFLCSEAAAPHRSDCERMTVRDFGLPRSGFPRAGFPGGRTVRGSD